MVLHRKLIAASITLLFSTLACRAATRLIIPDTPTPLPPTPIPPTATFIPPTLTPIYIPEAGCPASMANIVDRSLDSDGGSSENLDEEIYLAAYNVEGDDLDGPFNESVPEEFKDEQSNRIAHEDIWELFTRLIPLEQREFLSGFAIITDGEGEVLAAVGQDDRRADEWVLEVDIIDAEKDKDVLAFTLLHEFAHLLTLNSTQVPPSLPVFNNPENDNVYQNELAACSTYFPGEGCSNPDSYINQFFDRFWFDLFPEWQEIDAEEDEDTYYDLLDDFYDTYEDQFLTDYAPTSPAEDIAETFAFFVLSPQPELTSIANEKILFFYEFPELVQLRAEILNGVCAEFPSPP